MSFYKPQVTAYMMAVAEGTIIGDLLKPDYATVWKSLFRDYMLRYDVADVTPKWDGDHQNTDMASSPEVYEALLAVFDATTPEDIAEKDAILRKAFDKTLGDLIGTASGFGDEVIAEFPNYKTGWYLKQWMKKVAEENGSPNSSVTAAVSSMSTALWRYYLRYDLHLAAVTRDDGAGSKLSKNLKTLQKISAISSWAIGQIFGEVTVEAGIVLQDLLDIEEGVEPLQHLSAKSRNRILMQCEGYGGWQVRIPGAIVELTTIHKGRRGLSARISEDDGEDAEEKVERDLETWLPYMGNETYEPLVGHWRQNVPYYGQFGFKAGTELLERKQLGWVTDGTGDGEFTTVREKSFLDGIAPGVTGISKVILFMNWYTGGMASWYHTRAGDTSGSLMRESATPADMIVAAGAIKIDTHFTIADVIASSKLPKDGSIRDLAHHKMDYREGDVVVYKQKRTTTLAHIEGFKAVDCQFQQLDTLVNKKRDVFGNITGWFGDTIGEITRQ